MNLNFIVIVLFFVVLFAAHFIKKSTKMSRLQKQMNYLISSEDGHEILIMKNVAENQDLKIEDYHKVYADYIAYMKNWYAETNIERNANLYKLAKGNSADFFKKTFYSYLSYYLTYSHHIPYGEKEAYNTLYNIVCNLLRNK